MTDSTGTPYGDDVPDGSTRIVNGKTEIFQLGEWMELSPFEQPIVDPGTAQGDAESTQGTAKRADRPVRPSWLHAGVDILRKTASRYWTDTGTMNPVHDYVDGERRLDAQFYAQLKALMVAGWLAPDERTIGVPNGLVLYESQWRALSNDDSTWVILPGGESALELIVRLFQSPPSVHVREQLWQLREDSRDTTRQNATWDKHGQRNVTVPRSFLYFIVTLVVELRRAGDYAAANSLDNALATIQGELRTAGIDWHDGGEVAQAPAPSAASDPELAQLHRDIITVLRYVSGGFDYARAPTYPDTQARRALGAIDAKNVPVGTETHGHPLPWWSPLRAAAGTSPPSSSIKPVRGMTIGEAQELLAAYEVKYPEFTRVGTGPDTAVTRSVDRTNERAIDALRRDLELAHTELEKIKREGVPGVVHEVDLAFHKLTITERNHAWAESENRKQRIDKLEVEIERMKRRLEDDRLHPAETWAKLEGIRLTNYHGWDREGRDIRTPITRTQFLELAELCKYVVLEGLEPNDSREESGT